MNGTFAPLLPFVLGSTCVLSLKLDNVPDTARHTNYTAVVNKETIFCNKIGHTTAMSVRKNADNVPHVLRAAKPLHAVLAVGVQRGEPPLHEDKEDIRGEVLHSLSRISLGRDLGHFNTIEVKPLPNLYDHAQSMTNPDEPNANEWPWRVNGLQSQDIVLKEEHDNRTSKSADVPSVQTVGDQTSNLLLLLLGPNWDEDKNSNDDTREAYCWWIFVAHSVWSRVKNGRFFEFGNSEFPLMRKLEMKEHELQFNEVLWATVSIMHGGITLQQLDNVFRPQVRQHLANILRQIAKIHEAVNAKKTVKFAESVGYETCLKQIDEDKHEGTRDGSAGDGRGRTRRGTRSEQAGSSEGYSLPTLDKDGVEEMISRATYDQLEEELEKAKKRASDASSKRDSELMKVKRLKRGMENGRVEYERQRDASIEIDKQRQELLKQLGENKQLLQIAMRVRDELQSRLDDVEPPNMCQICYTRPFDTMLRPCGHILCEDCKNHNGQRPCPFCRRLVEDTLEVFVP